MRCGRNTPRSIISPATFILRLIPYHMTLHPEVPWAAE
jgi:hypothetical protein